MAGQVPDPQSLNSWEDAFQHPLPVVRKLEQQLRRNIDDNRTKLRSLVGTSYRDLLGTAERIIEMNDQMQTVERYESDIGRKCNARTVERIANNHTLMRESKDAREHARCGAMAQTKVLRSALTTISRTIKAGGNALLASKLLVLSRLLHKSISESSDAPLILEDLRRNLGVLRKKLLSYIDRTVARQSTDRSMLTQTLCAYALITSSTFKEVLRHFLQVRYEHLQSNHASTTEKDALKVLELYRQTLLDTRELFPRRFEEALSYVAKRPLLVDEQVQSTYELGLDVYGSWVAENVRAFTPWVRHDQITTTEVAEALDAWAKQAQDSLLDCVRNYLKDQDDAQSVVSSRHTTISKFMVLNAHLRPATFLECLTNLREVFLARLQALSATAADCHDLSLEATQVSTLSALSKSESALWDIPSRHIDLDHGALRFRQSLLQKRRGRNNALQTESDKLDEWVKRIDVMFNIIDEMRVSKWDSELDTDLEDLDDGDSMRNALNMQDPDQMRSKLRDAVQATLEGFDVKMSSVAADTAYAVFYLRMWREVDQRRRVLAERLDLPAGEVSLSVLYRNISQLTSRGVIDDFLKSSRTHGYVAVTLWNGTPALPTQPSPTTFKLLTKLQRVMSDAGADLWSQQCISELKTVVMKSLEEGLKTTGVANAEGTIPLTNGHADTDNADDNDEASPSEGETGATDRDKNKLLQNLFDLYYLRRIFQGPEKDHSNQGPLIGLVRAIKSHLDIENASDERLRKSANEYWRRTYLLLGLLAPESDEKGR